ncbi:recombinase family protein [Anaerococcus sp. Marseille-P3625]|uniref:recombinase family protein n=1 Tax=Anaerococcus sp. Marseille-P3625 TaxID=1977277 RepID=UPI000C07275F|nr:recombinase family protein [Anaerococcus sp. Marseille-P3625]
MSKIALYIRLSVEDMIKTDESESIINQRAYLNDYLDMNEEFKNFTREEYVDDGYSGTNENRPAFQRMLEDVKKNNIQTIIVKDLSRFMRDYITLGDYLENIFPFLGVRFIAINDGYDSNKEKGNGTDLDIQFKGLLYDFYTKDISEKVKSSMTTLKKQGKFLAWSPPLGYMKDPNNRHKIIVDEETAWIVKKIFKLALDGISSRNIAKILNEEKIPTPSKRKSELTNLDFEYSIIRTAKKPRPTWTNGNVIDVLANENYTGTYTFNMQDKSVLNPASFKFKPKEEWGRVENNHEAIISKEDFEKVQKIKEKNLFMKGKNIDYEWRKKSPLQGFAKCPTCNHILGCIQSKHKRPDGSLRVHTYFTCRICKCNNVKHKNSRAGSLEEQVFEAIKEKYGLEAPNKDEKVKVKPMEKSIEDLETKKMKNFEKYKLGKMNRQKFIDSKNLIDEEIQAIKEKILKAKEEKEVLDNTKLTRELMEKYIDSVICEGNEVLNIKWK